MDSRVDVLVKAVAFVVSVLLVVDTVERREYVLKWHGIAWHCFEIHMAPWMMELSVLNTATVHHYWTVVFGIPQMSSAAGLHREASFVQP